MLPTVRNNLKPLNFPSLLETNYRFPASPHTYQRKFLLLFSEHAPHTSCHLQSSVILHMATFIKNATICSISPQDEPSHLTDKLNTTSPEQKSHLLTSVIAPTSY